MRYLIIAFVVAGIGGALAQDAAKPAPPVHAKRTPRMLFRSTASRIRSRQCRRRTRRPPLLPKAVRPSALACPRASSRKRTCRSTQRPNKPFR